MASRRTTLRGWRRSTGHRRHPSPLQQPRRRRCSPPPRLFNRPHHAAQRPRMPQRRLLCQQSQRPRQRRPLNLNRRHVSPHTWQPTPARWRPAGTRLYGLVRRPRPTAVAVGLCTATKRRTGVHHAWASPVLTRSSGSIPASPTGCGRDSLPLLPRAAQTRPGGLPLRTLAPWTGRSCRPGAQRQCGRRLPTAAPRVWRGPRSPASIRRRGSRARGFSRRHAG